MGKITINLFSDPANGPQEKAESFEVELDPQLIPLLTALLTEARGGSINLKLPMTMKAAAALGQLRWGNALLPEEQAKRFANLSKHVDELELSVRSRNGLRDAGIKYVHELVVKTEGEVLKMDNLGRKSLNEIKYVLNDLKLKLGTDPEDLPPGLPT